jgi:hypothetical protein
MTKKSGKAEKKQNNNNQKPMTVSKAKGQTMKANPTNAVNVPFVSFKERKSYFQVSGGNADSVRIKGCDFLSSFAWGTGITAGSAIQNVLVSPGAGALVSTRLGKFAQLYEKYVFKRLQFFVQSSANTNVSGSYILSYDRDVSDPTPPGNSQDSIRQYLAHAGSRAGAAWESISIDCRLTDTQDFYYTNPSAGGDERLCYQGQVYMACMSPINAQQTFNMWVEYDILLMDPQLETTVTESKQTATSGTTSATAKAAWNTAATAAISNPIVPFITDINGNRGINIPPGTWLLEQALGQSTAGGNALIQSSVFDSESLIDVTSSVLSNLDTAYAGLVAAANSTGYRAERIINNGPNNLLAFGNMSTGGQTITNQFIRILEMLGTNLI